MKRGFLGDAEVSVDNYWTAGKCGQELRCNETVLYAEIDCCQEYVNIAETQEEVQEQYSKMDMFWLCLKAIEYYSDNIEKLRIAGIVIGNMLSAGDLSVNYNSLEEENDAVVALCEQMTMRVEQNNEAAYNDNFMQWYESNVLDLNYYHNLDGSKTIDKPRLNGLGALHDDDYYSKRVKEGGMYMLYLVTDTDGKDGNAKMVARKKMEQMKNLNWLHGAGNNLTLQSMVASARSGIVAKMSKKPENVLKDLKNESVEFFKNNPEEKKKLGFIMTLTTLSVGAGLVISALISAAVVLAQLIVSYVKEKKLAEIQAAAAAKDTAGEPGEDDFNNSSPDYPEWADLLKQSEQAAAAEEAKASASKEKYEKALIQSQSQSGEEEESIFKKTWFWLTAAGVGLVGILGAVAISKKRKQK